MEKDQIVLRVKLPNQRTCFISNTNSDFVVVWEDVSVGIGIHEMDIYNDTKKQLGNVEQLSWLKQLRDFLKKEIESSPQSSDNIAFNQMLRALGEIITEREAK